MLNIKNLSALLVFSLLPGCIVKTEEPVVKLFEPPRLPDSYYPGPYGSWPGCQQMFDFVRENGRSMPRDPKYVPREYRITHGGHEYTVIKTLEALDIYPNEKTVLHPTGHSFFSVNCNDGWSGSQWWSSIRGSTGSDNCELYMARLTSNLPEVYAALSPDTILYRWRCDNRSKRDVIKEWNEAVLPSGEVVQAPKSRPGASWIPTPKEQCWVCDPSLIPEEARLDQDPFLKWFFKEARKQ